MIQDDTDGSESFKQCSKAEQGQFSAQWLAGSRFPFSSTYIRVVNSQAWRRQCQTDTKLTFLAVVEHTASMPKRYAGLYITKRQQVSTTPPRANPGRLMLSDAVQPR